VRYFGTLPAHLGTNVQRLKCNGCGKSYQEASTEGSAVSWTHYDRYMGSNPPVRWAASEAEMFTGSMCDRCTVTHMYKTQDIFLDFLRLVQVTRKLEQS